MMSAEFEKVVREAKLYNIRHAYEQGIDVWDPELQIPHYIRFGVEFLQENQDLTVEDVSDEQIEIWLKCGGTDHPDPTPEIDGVVFYDRI